MNGDSEIAADTASVASLNLMMQPKNSDVSDAATVLCSTQPDTSSLPSNKDNQQLRSKPLRRSARLHHGDNPYVRLRNPPAVKVSADKCEPTPLKDTAQPLLPTTSTPTTPTPTPTPTLTPTLQFFTKIANVAIAPFMTKPNPRTQVAPAYIDECHRQFANPISYLGGPQLQARNRNSIESILSLD